MRSFRVSVPLVLLASVLASIGAIAQPSSTSGNTRFLVRDYGAVGDGKALDTTAIQNAIRAAHDSGGGTVVFTPGIYRSGTFELLSNVTLDLNAGAVLKGSDDINDYRSISDFGFARHYGVDSTGEGFKLGIIVARHAKNISIIGRGTIDGNSDAFVDPAKPHYSMDFDPKFTRQGAAFMNTILNTGDGPIDFGPSGRPGTMIALMDVKNVLMRDVTLHHSPNWTVHMQTVQGGVVEGVHIDNDLRVPNNDGFDCMQCRDVHFSDCDIKTGDDDFAIVSSENITVSNCSMTSYSSAIRLEDTRDSVFSNLVLHGNRGIGIYERGGGHTSNVTFSGLTIDTFLLTGHWWGKGEPIYLAIGDSAGRAGEIRDIHFSDIVAEAENGIVLYGDPQGNIENVTLDHVTLHYRVTRPDVNAQVGGNFDLRWTASSPSQGIFSHDWPGLYARYVHGLSIDGLHMRWDAGMPAFYSSAMEIENSQDVTINHFSGRQAIAGSDAPVIVLRHVNGISIMGSEASAGASVFLDLDHVTNQRIFLGNDIRHAARAFKGTPVFVQFGNRMPVRPPIRIRRH